MTGHITKHRDETFTKYRDDDGSLFGYVGQRDDEQWEVIDCSGVREPEISTHDTREQAEAAADNHFQAYESDEPELSLWKLERQSPGYEESSAIVVAAYDENTARLHAVRIALNAGSFGSTGPTDFALAELAAVTRIGTALYGAKPGDALLVA